MASSPPDPASETTIDHLLAERVTLHQPAKGYRVGIDPVFLAAFAAPAHGARVLDAGTGTGAVALCLLARRPDLTITGLELDAQAAALAAENAIANGCEHALTIHRGDLFSPPPAVRDSLFDAVVSNPPFHEAGGNPSPDPRRAAATHSQAERSLADWVSACLKRVKSRGWLYLIVRADRCPEVLATLHPGCGAISVLPIRSRAGEDAIRVLIAARKEARTPMRLLPDLVVHTADGSYTPQAWRVLRDMATLPEPLADTQTDPPASSLC